MKARHKGVTCVPHDPLDMYDTTQDAAIRKIKGMERLEDTIDGETQIMEGACSTCVCRRLPPVISGMILRRKRNPEDIFVDYTLRTSDPTKAVDSGSY